MTLCWRPTTGRGLHQNNDSADDVRDVDLTTVHYLSGPVGVKGAEPGDLLVVDLLDIGAKDESQWGFNGFFSQKNGGGFLTDHFPSAQKSIWDFQGMFTTSRHIPGVRYAGLIHPGLIGTLPDPKMLDIWNTREQALIDTNPDGNLANPPFMATAHMGQLKGEARDKAAATGARTVPPRGMAATATSRTSRAAPRSSSPSMSMERACRWAICTSARAMAKSPSAARSKWPAGCT